MADSQKEMTDIFGNPITSTEELEKDMFGNPITSTEKEKTVDEVQDIISGTNVNPNAPVEVKTNIPYEDVKNQVGVKPTSYPTREMAVFNFLGQQALSMSDEDFSTLNLPKPSSTMYEGLDFSEAEALYKKYRNHPNYGGGGYNYTDPNTGEKDKVIVPLPKEQLNIPFIGNVTSPTAMLPFETKADVSTMDIVEGGFTNFVGDIAETSGAIIDWASTVVMSDEWEKENPEGLGINKYIKEKYPEYNFGSGTDALIGETGPLISGGFLGKATITGVMNLGPKLPGLVQNFAKFAGFDAGVSASVDEDLGGLLIGSDPKQKLINLDSWTGGLTKGIEVDIDSPEWEQALSKRANIFLDGLIASGIAQKGIEGTGAVAKLFYSFGIKPIITPFNKASKEDILVKEQLNNILSVIGKSPDDAEAIKGIVKLIEDNKEAFSTIIKGIDDEEITIALSTMDAFEQGLKNIDISKYPELNLSASDIRRLQSTAKGINKNAETPGSAVADVRAEPTRILEDVTRQVEDAAGGSSAVKEGTEAIQDVGTLEITTAKNNVDDLTKRLEIAKGDVELLIKNDPELGPKLKALSELDDFNFEQLPRGSAEELETYIRKSYDDMTFKKDELYRAVSDGEVDAEGIIQALNNMTADQLALGKSGLGRAEPLANLLDLATKKMVKVGDDLVEETDDVILDRVKEFLSRGDGVSYGDLYQFRSKLAKIKNDLYSKGGAVEGGTADALNQFIRYIDEEALDYASKQNPLLDDAVSEAKNYYSKDYAPFWRDKGVLEEYARNYNVVRNLPGDLPAGTLDNNTKLLTDIIDDPKAVNQTSNIVKLINTSDNPEVVSDYIIGNAAVKLKQLLARGKSFDDIEVQTLLDSLDNYGSTLAKDFPDQSKNLQTFINNFRNQKGTVANITEELDEAIKVSNNIEENIYSKKLKDFFDDRNIPIQGEQGFSAINKIIKRGDLNLIDDLLVYADQDPIIRDALKSAYSKSFRNNVLGSTPEFSGAANLKTGQAQAVQEELNNILDAGKKIFADQPEIPNALESILDLSYVITGNRRARDIAGTSDTFIRTQAKQASDRAITYIFGVLNRIGARVRSGVTGILNSVDDEIGAITDAVLSDPDEFIRIANRIAESAEPATFRKEIMLPYLTRSYGIVAQDEEAEIELLNILGEVEQELVMKGNDLKGFIIEGIEEAQDSFLK